MKKEAKNAAKNTASKKTVAKKPAVKSAPAKKTSVKKTEPKKPVTKTTAKTKTTTKKSPARKPKPVIDKIITPTQAELMCKGVDPRIRAQAVSLANAVITLQNKIIQQTAAYEEAPLFQEVIVNTGERVMRANPLVQEFRATVRDYAAAMKNLDEILNAKKGMAEKSPLDELKSKFKIS